MVVCSLAQTEGIITSGICEIGRCFTSSSSEIALTSPTKYSSPFDICGFQKVTAVIEAAAIHLLGLNPVSHVPYLPGGKLPRMPNPTGRSGCPGRVQPQPWCFLQLPGWHNLLSNLLALLCPTRTLKSRGQKEIQA